MRPWYIGGALVGGTIIGAVLGAVLSTQWWDFPPEDVENYGAFIPWFYGALGAISGFVLSGVALVTMWAVHSLATYLRDILRSDA